MKRSLETGSTFGVYNPSPRESRFARAVLLVLGIFFFVFPLLTFFIKGILNFEIESLTGPFWQLLFRSFFLALFQALLSSFFSLLLALVLAFCFFDSELRLLHRFLNFVEPLSFLIFSLPLTTVSLVLLDYSRFLGWSLQPGFWPIVLCHVAVNSLFLGFRIKYRVESFLQASGSEMVAAAQTLGAGHLKIFWALIWPQILGELRALFFLVFLWSFTAVSSVIILGGGPRFSTPETLLFYSLLGEGLGTRVFVLGFLQGLLFVLMSRLVLGGFWKESLELSRKSFRTKLDYRWPWKFFRRLVGLLLVLIFVSPFLYLWSPFLKFSTLYNQIPKLEFWEALQQTFLLAFLCFIFSGILFLLLLAAAPIDRKRWASVLGFSSALLGAAWLGLDFDLWAQGSSLFQILLAALALSLLQLPVAALWIQSYWSQDLEFLEQAAQTLGANFIKIFWFLRLPAFFDVFSRILLSSVALALGELLITGLFLRDVTLMSQFSRLLSAKYFFEEAAFVNALMGFIFVFFFAFLKNMERIFRKRKRSNLC